jgi:bifunctional DNA-binding transcriptional regulator/antitoxin component of YhaV-PrlF toxin-antitoxin module
MSDETLLVGKRGEIYTDEKLRRATGIRKGGRVKATVTDGRLIIEPFPSLEDLLKGPSVAISAKEAERLSEEAQKEAGLLG